MPSINTEVYVGYVDVDVDLEDFDTEDLREELARRGEAVTNNYYALKLLSDIYEKRRNGQDYTYELDTVLHEILGRIS